MSLQDTISLLIQKHGKDVLSNPCLMAMLDDYGAFREEEPATRIIVRELIRTGQVQKIIGSSKSGRDLQFEVRTVVTETARSGGFREEVVSDALKKMVIGSGKIQREKDWPQPTNPTPPTPTTQWTAMATKQSKSHNSTSVWKSIVKWTKKILIGLLICIPVVCAVLTVIHFVMTIYHLVEGPPDAGESHAWKFLIYLICTGISGLIAVAIYEFD